MKYLAHFQEFNSGLKKQQQLNVAEEREGEKERGKGVCAVFFCACSYSALEQKAF